MGIVSPREAVTFGIVLSVTSIALLAATTTLLAAALAAGAIFYYAVLYTVVFKRHTRRSTEFGGVPGAAPNSVLRRVCRFATTVYRTA